MQALLGFTDWHWPQRGILQRNIPVLRCPRHFLLASQHRYRLTEQSDKLDDPVSERNIAIWNTTYRMNLPQDRWRDQAALPHLISIPTQ